MKPTTTSIAVESTIQGERIEMGVAQHALAHIMSVLTNMYSDPEYAPLREYSTNAWDSHVMAGVTRPIRVTTPTDLAPFLTVKDFGTGLSVDEIREIYSQYGASTKRDSNDQNGMLGIGCKSALAYATQFTMIAIKDGFRSIVSISRDEDGGGSMTVLEVSPTDDEPGVEIQIPAKKHNDFERKAKHLFSFWEEGTVLVNGLEPERVDGLWVDDDMVIVDGDQDYLVMGNVAYPVDFDVLPGNGGRSLVAFVPIGAVTIHPSRERLIDTALTKDAIESVREFFHERVTKVAQEEIEKCATPWDALKMAVAYRQSLYKRDQPPFYSYKGQQIPMIINAPRYEIEEEQIGPRGGKKKVKVKHQAPIISTSATSSTLSSHGRNVQVQANYAATALIIHNYTAGNFTAAMKKRLNKYCEENGVKTDHYLLCRVKFAEQWLDPSRMVDWEEIKKVTLPSYGGRVKTNRIPGSYDMYINGQHKTQIEANDIDVSKPVYYMEKDAFIARRSDGSYNQEQAMKVLAKYRPNCTVVILPSNRVEKFCRNFPQAKHAWMEFMSIYKRTVSKISADSILSAAIQDDYSQKTTANELDPTKVNDPAILRWLRLAKATPSKAMRKLDGFHNVLSYRDRSKRLDMEAENPMNNYPLFSLRNLRDAPEHTYAYLNAAYAAGLAVASDDE